MAKRVNGKKSIDNQIPWILVIEFNGLCAAELVRPPDCDLKPEVIIHFVDDAMHNPMLAVRDRDVKEARDCRPDYKVLVRSETHQHGGGEQPKKTEPPTTLSLWSPLRGSHQQVEKTKRWSLDVDTKPAEMDGDTPKNRKSLRWLPTLGDILGSNSCDPLHDFAQFRLTEGAVRPGRLDTRRRWRITAGEFKKEGPLAVTIVYELVLTKDSVVLDLHPGLLTVGPPKHARKSGRPEHMYRVEMTYSSLPVSTLPAHQPLRVDHRVSADGAPEHPSTQHFNEYNRLVGTEKMVTIVELPEGPEKDTVEDPIHCFDAVVLP